MLHALRSCTSKAPATRFTCGSMTTRTVPKAPLVLILGATGTGKSNLAIQIAQSYLRASSDTKSMFSGAEVINADAMQLYRGLPIITNKVTTTEQQGVTHHLLDHIGLGEEPWTVQQYVKQADRVIQEVRDRKSLPIVVGGTSYYVYGLLFKDAMLDQAPKDDVPADGDEDMTAHGKEAAQTWPILAASTPEIYAKLQEVDPEMASRWHPNDRRKIQRSLEIYLKTGRKASQIYHDQKQGTNRHRTYINGEDVESDKDGSTSADSLRYDPIIFWLEAQDQTLKDRLNRRVDAMVEKGLLEEAKVMRVAMHNIRETGVSLDESKGIWVSIGYKEMAPWLKRMDEGNAECKEIDQLRSACIEAVKAGTRQYAKRQNRFIRIRLANALATIGASDKLFLLDCTDLEKWQENVLEPALAGVKNFLTGDQLPNPSDLSPLARTMFENTSTKDVIPERIARRCETCDKVLMTEKEWNNHMNSRSHKNVLQGIRKREMNAARLKAILSSAQDGSG